MSAYGPKADISVCAANVRSSMVEMRTDVLLVSPDTFFATRREQIVELAARKAIPTMYYNRDFAEAGGLISYGDKATDGYRQVGIYAGRILKGEKPATLPVIQSTKFELVINLKTARALGLDVPHSLRSRADELID
jgi:putative ABC transport system substrate-binding protein